MSKENFELKSYDHKHRWVSYWYQIREVFKLDSGKFLEIGVGNRFLYDYLKKAGKDVVSVDINPERNPDYVGDVTSLPFEDNTFEAILCFQVLEHLPFDNFKKAILEMKRVSKKHILISLPHWGRTFYFIFKMPFIKEIKFLFKIPGFSKYQFDGEHYWEIGRRDYSLRKIKSTLRSSNLRIIRDYICPDSPFHHFFILEKQDE